MSKAIDMRLIQEIASMTADVFKEKNVTKEAISLITKQDIHEALSKIDSDKQTVLDNLDQLRNQVQNGEVLGLTFCASFKNNDSIRAQIFEWSTHSLMLGFSLLNSLHLCTDIAERISEITGYKPENLEEELRASLAQLTESLKESGLGDVLKNAQQRATQNKEDPADMSWVADLIKEIQEGKHNHE